LYSPLFIGAVLFSAQPISRVAVAVASFVKLSLVLSSFYLCDKLACAFQYNHPPLFLSIASQLHSLEYPINKKIRRSARIFVK
jgi:hypothetical protein